MKYPLEPAPFVGEKGAAQRDMMKRSGTWSHNDQFNSNVSQWEPSRLMFPLLNQVNQSVPDVHSQAVVGHSDLLLLQIDGEHRFVGDVQLAPLLLSQDGHSAGSHDGVLIPHQLHSGQIWVQRGKVEKSQEMSRKSNKSILL